MQMNKMQPCFDFGWFEEPKHPPLSVLFVAYLQQVAPELVVSNKPIHKTPVGYSTNNSPWQGVGAFEFDLTKGVIVHRYKVSQFIGGKYEYAIEETTHKVEFLSDRMLVA